MSPRRRPPGTQVDRRAVSSMVQVRIGTQVYDAQYEPACHTCTHPARMMIEERIIQGESYRRIAMFFSGTEIEVQEGRRALMPEISFTSIRNHFVRGHMPMEAATLRRLAERRAVQMGKSVEDSELLVDQFTFSEAVVHKAYARLASGEIQPEVKDGLAAAKFLQDVEDRTQAGLDAEAWTQAMTIYFEAARRVMPEPLWQEFTGLLSTNPILRAMQQKMDPHPDDVVDAEIVHPGDN